MKKDGQLKMVQFPKTKGMVAALNCSHRREDSGWEKRRVKKRRGRGFLFELEKGQKEKTKLCNVKGNREIFVGKKGERERTELCTV